MTYRGHVENGVVVLDEEQEGSTLAERLRDVIGIGEGPPDLVDFRAGWDYPEVEEVRR